MRDGRAPRYERGESQRADTRCEGGAKGFAEVAQERLRGADVGDEDLGVEEKLWGAFRADEAVRVAEGWEGAREGCECVGRVRGGGAGVDAWGDE